MQSVALDAMAAWSFLQRSVPAVAMAAASARWSGGVLGSLLECRDVAASVQPMLLDLEAAWRAITAAPRAITIAPPRRSTGRVEMTDLCEGTEWRGPGTHPKESLKGAAGCRGAVRFVVQTGRREATRDLTRGEQEASRPLLDVQFSLVEAAPRLAAFSRAQGRAPAHPQVRCVPGARYFAGCPCQCISSR